jgi:hypothetical protein
VVLRLEPDEEKKDSAMKITEVEARVREIRDIRVKGNRRGSPHPTDRLYGDVLRAIAEGRTDEQRKSPPPLSRRKSPSCWPSPHKATVRAFRQNGLDQAKKLT